MTDLATAGPTNPLRPRDLSRACQVGAMLPGALGSAPRSARGAASLMGANRFAPAL